jgi:organic hydroperoxide reductase OsmC/OhrA
MPAAGRRLMASYTATITWERAGQDFVDGRYSRSHRVAFDGGVDIEGSASPHVVRPPMASETGVDPEELLVASLSSCHMLSFVDLARRAGWRVDRYVDHAEGWMERLEQGRFAVTRVTLRPEVTLSGDRIPSEAEFADLHHQAHEVCFIANSVKTDVTVAPTLIRETADA